MIKNSLTQKIIDKKVSSMTKEKRKEFDFTVDKLNKLSGTKYDMIDAHIHIVDFNQETAGLKNLLYYMDKSNVKKSVIFGMPMTKLWDDKEKQRPDYYLDDDNKCYYYHTTDTIVGEEYLSLNKKEKSRFFPLMCWFNPLDINCLDHIKRTFNSFPWVFCGLWESMFRHDDLTHLTYWEAPRFNTKAVERILEFISDYDIPYLIHNNITAPWVSDFPKFLHELESMLRKFPKAKIVLAHCWASRRLKAPYYAKMIWRLLKEYPGLYVDYSWVIYDDIIAFSDVSFLEWLEMTEEFSDRIMIGSDILWVWFHEIWYINNRFNKFLDKLSEKARRDITYTTANKLYSSGRNSYEKWLKRDYPSLGDFV